VHKPNDVHAPLSVDPKGRVHLQLEVIGSDERHKLRFEEDGTRVFAALHPWNHAPRELPHRAFETLRDSWTAQLLMQHSHITDFVSGKRLDTLQQCVALDLESEGRGRAMDVADVEDLGAWLHNRHKAFLLGEATTQASAALLVAAPAAGKTTLLSQLVMFTLEDETVELVPIVVSVQRMQARMSDVRWPETFANAWNMVDAYLRLEHSSEPQLYRFLR
jgi:hypothetical protein